jgi:riboflavin synthase
MFTGIIKEIGKVEKLAGGKLSLRAPGIAPGLKPGDSVSVSGVCLTLVTAEGPRLCLDVLDQTLKVTNLGGLRPGDPVNLEPALRAGEEMGGHFVSGHVDGVARLVSLASEGKDRVLTVDLPPSLRKGVVARGSIALEGVSLTVAGIREEGVSVHLIPFTLAHTNLGMKKTGALLNVETDMLGKYVSSFLSAVPAERKLEEHLRRSGFL